ncbi:MAG: MBL fold metallo-hydrolase [Clostridiales bacterium]|nr:MBL fold metallo-hydrolase [Clostridiales bacterium]
MKIEFCSLSSGSGGNATYISAGNTRILIDAGLSGKTVTAALNSIGVLPESLNAILVTHEHIDHVKGVGILSRKYHIPVYANENTWNRMSKSVGEVPLGMHRIFETDNDFYIDDLSVMPIAIQHDSAEPVAFRVFAGGRSVAVATDMGVISKRVIQQLSGVDLLLLESNHDIEMLRQNQRYSESLKRRILGNKGHLSNDSCSLALMSLYETGVKHVLLGHLSEDNNTPELAMHAVSTALSDQGLKTGSDIFLEMTWRDRTSGFYTIE